MPEINFGAVEATALLSDVKTLLANGNPDDPGDDAINAKYDSTAEAAKAVLAKTLASIETQRASALASAQFARATLAARIDGASKFLASGSPVTVTLPDPPADPAAPDPAPAS